MAKNAFDKIAAGLEDAIAFAQGDKARGKLVRPIDVKAIRQATNLSQNQFAKIYHLPVSTIQDWEQQRRAPDAPGRVLLSMIEADPQAVAKMIEKIG